VLLRIDNPDELRSVAEILAGFFEQLTATRDGQRFLAYAENPADAPESITPPSWLKPCATETEALRHRKDVKALRHRSAGKKKGGAMFARRPIRQSANLRICEF
jgi:hypothetical protein